MLCCLCALHVWFRPLYLFLATGERHQGPPPKATARGHARLPAACQVLPSMGALGLGIPTPHQPGYWKHMGEAGPQSHGHSRCPRPSSTHGSTPVRTADHKGDVNDPDPYKLGLIITHCAALGIAARVKADQLAGEEKLLFSCVFPSVSFAAAYM